MQSKTAALSAEVLDAVKSGFKYAAKAGPLCGEPMRGVQASIVDFTVAPDAACNEIMRGVSKAVFASFLTAEPALLEPIYRVEITVASELAGESSRILQTRRGKVTAFNQKGQLTQLVGFIPVAETFGFSKELRSATSGRAVWQSIFSHWEVMPQRLAAETISGLRRRKGLAEDVPKPEKFMEQP
jgi:elongation factor 2